MSKRSSARIQRLCCLGIGGEMPDLMREVKELIPSRHRIFFWLGSSFEITNTYHTFSPAIVKLFFEEFYMTDREAAVVRTIGRLKDWPPSPSPVRQLEQNLLVDRRTFLRSEFTMISGGWPRCTNL